MVEPSEREAPTLPEDAVTLLRSPFDRTSLGHLRGELTVCGASNGLTDLNLSNFVLAVNEIATNAVRHGGGTGRLALWRQADELWCEIIDTGGGIPSGRVNGFHRPQPGHIGGWGLWLARHICKSVDIESGLGGTRVVLRYPIPPPAPA